MMGARMIRLLLRKESIFLVVITVFLGHKPVTADGFKSVSFLSSNFQSCSGHCDKANIDCDKNSKEHGSYHWCKKNCISSTKVDKEKYHEGVQSCHEATEEHTTSTLKAVADSATTSLPAKE